MTFKFTLEDNNKEGAFTFVTVEDCIDMDDAINHIHSEFPNHTIEHINKIHSFSPNENFPLIKRP